MQADLKSGDVISYSSGTTQMGVNGFRVIRNHIGNILECLSKDQKDFVGTLQGTIVINCYPATVLNSNHTILVDSYMNSKTASRALGLAAETGRPAIIVAQSLFAAEVLYFHHLRRGRFPHKIVLATGGYYMPRSLEHFMQTVVDPAKTMLSVIQLYGVAEVDMGCLVAFARDPFGSPIYQPRDERVEIGLENEQLILSLKDHDGDYVIKNYPTGDRALACGDGVILDKTNRIQPKVLEQLDHWNYETWARRTGYLTASTAGFTYQLRSQANAAAADELSYFAFADQTGQTFLSKPDWLGKSW